MAMFVQNKSHLYDAMIQDGWYLPAKKSSFVTIAVIYAIRRKELWAPRQSEITQVVQRAKPPPINKLVEYIAEHVT